jgi:hypothetical protein
LSPWGARLPARPHRCSGGGLCAGWELREHAGVHTAERLGPLQLEEEIPHAALVVDAPRLGASTLQDGRTLLGPARQEASSHVYNVVVGDVVLVEVVELLRTELHALGMDVVVFALAVWRFLRVDVAQQRVRCHAERRQIRVGAGDRRRTQD